MENNEEQPEELSRFEKIEKALREIFAEEDALLSRWLLITESMPEEGKDLDCYYDESMEEWECIGLLRSMQLILEDQVVSYSYGTMYFTDDDE